MRLPPFGERRVGARHLERRRRLGAEPDREVALQRRRDARAAFAVSRTFRGPDDRRQLREDRVVGVRDRLRRGRSARGTRPRSC